MKKIFLPFALLVICFALLLSSCSKEYPAVPRDPTSNSPNAKFLGEWYVTENSSLYGSSTYTLNIADSTNNAYTLIAYLYGFHTKIKATVSTTNITIPTQIIEGNSISGAGTLGNSNHINLTYYVNSGFNKDTIKAVLIK